jgi:vibriolysin
MKHRNRIILSVVLICGLGALNAVAAERVQLKDNTDRLAAGLASTPSLFTDNPALLLGLSYDNSLAVRRSSTNKKGDTINRYQQHYKAIPVLGDHAIIATRADGSFKLAYGSILRDIASDISAVKPKLKGKTVTNAAKLNSLAQDKWLPNRDASYENEMTRLAIWQDSNGTAKLVYEVTFVQYTNEPSRPHYIIDATTGEILDYYDNLQTANGTGPGGNLKTGQYEYGTDFGYMDVDDSGSSCVMENSVVKTVNLNHGSSGSTAWSYPCYRNTTKEINGAYAPLNDAHYFGKVVFDVYSDWLNATPINVKLQLRVHYLTRYENAFWNGSTMTFGDGYNTFYPLVSLDVVAHEVSHGYTEQNSDLIYSGKPGGLNESFSDVAGEAAEFYNTGTNDWMVGEQIFKANGALRYMIDPTRDGRSIGHQSDYYSGLDVHYSSGVFNRAFYLLATTSGWDTKMAFLAYATANKNYWTPSVNWDNAGGGVMDAACDLGYDVNDVQNALATVGVTSYTSPGSECGTPIEETEFENGVTVGGISGSSKDQDLFYMEVPANASNLQFNTGGGSGDADLYVKFGSIPTLEDYDCRSISSNSTENCTFNNPQTGTYHVMVEAWNSINNVSLTGSYQ